MTSSPAFDFTALAARLKPEADAVIARYPEPRSALLPIMYRFQQEQGYVSPEAITQTAEWLGLTPAVVESTISFYSLFFRQPVGKYMLQPCRGLSCIINGGYDIMRHFREQLDVEHLQTTPDGVFSYEEVECLAACDRAPCMQVNLEFFHDLTQEKVDAMLERMRLGAFEVPPSAQTKPPERTWHASHDTTEKSPGARQVPAPNAPGGVGDASGERMLERLRNQPHPVQVRPTQERSLQNVVPSKNGNATS